MPLKTLLVLISMCFTSNIVAKELYRNKKGDSGKYYIHEKSKLKNSQFLLLTSRVGKNDAYTTFTKLIIDCDTQQYFEIAGSQEDGLKDSPTNALKDFNNSDWTNALVGSSKGDLTSHVCDK
ncbi:hypothetical protein [Pseudoalteromonas xiamenensis]